MISKLICVAYMCGLEGFVRPKQYKKATPRFPAKKKRITVKDYSKSLLRYFQVSESIYKEEKEAKVVIMKCSDHTTLTINDIPFLLLALEPFVEL